MSGADAAGAPGSCAGRGASSTASRSEARCVVARCISLFRQQAPGLPGVSATRGSTSSGPAVGGRTWTATSFPALCLALLAALGGCRGGDEKAVEKAQARYLALVEAGTPAGAPAFDEVLELARAVPPSSPGAKRAQRLIDGILAARGTVARPLAVAHEGGLGLAPEVEAQAAACARLAEALGRDGGVSEEGRAELERCRRRVEALDFARCRQHDGEAPDGGAHAH